MLKTRIGILALTGMLALAACGTSVPTPTTPINVTTGSVTVNKPADYTLVVKDANGNVVTDLTQLTPGMYTFTYSKDGFNSQTVSVNVVAGSNTVTAPTLTPATTPGVYYVNASGQVVGITRDDLNNAGTRFVFYAWLENVAGAGVDPSKFGSNTDIGAPTALELDEVAPINTQNLAAGYVGFKAPDGKVYPVVGADVRWDILEETGNVRFSAADDGGLSHSNGVGAQVINSNAKTAETSTNRAGNENNARFPSSVQYPLYNLTGVTTPDINGVTWTALNHDPKFTRATARVRAIAYVNGTEITKVFLDKTFAPSAKLVISKDPAAQEALTNQDRNFRITVTNQGSGPATGIRLNDRLNSGNGAVYSITAPTGTTPNTTDGFDVTFDLAPGATRTFEFPARASATGVYCDLASITAYTNGDFGVVNPTDLRDEACLTVRAPQLTIIKEFVDASGNMVPDPTLPANTPATIRVTVRNGGDATATNVVVTDRLNGGASAAYGITTLPAGTTANTEDGFVAPAFDLAPNQTRTFTFPVSASADGTYCDTASFTSANAGTGADEACLRVATPALNITKVNATTTGAAANNLFPGSSYVSTIVVSNTGNATATSVAVKDLLGQLTGGTQFVNFGSGSYRVSNNATVGSVARVGNDITTVPATVDLPAGTSLTLSITSTIPAGASAGEYCDVASYTSSNAGNGQARACVTVAPFAAEQLQFTDLTDPITAGGTGTIYSGVYFVERTTNEAVTNHRLEFNLGEDAPNTAGVFTFNNIEVYFDQTPVLDPETGTVTSDHTNASARRLVAGTDYTVNAIAGTGQFTLVFPNTFQMTAGQVLYTRVAAFAPATINAGPYNSISTWTNTGVRSGFTYRQFKSESTTVVK